MMQSNEIEQRFSKIESSLRQLKLAVQSQQNIPQDLQECLHQFEQQTSQVKQALQAHDESRIVDSVDTLEQTSDRAKAAIGQTQNVDESVRRAVMQAHSELSQLKHQLH